MLSIKEKGSQAHYLSVEADCDEMWGLNLSHAQENQGPLPAVLPTKIMVLCKTPIMGFCSNPRGLYESLHNAENL